MEIRGEQTHLWQTDRVREWAWDLLSGTLSSLQREGMRPGVNCAGTVPPESVKLRIYAAEETHKICNLNLKRQGMTPENRRCPNYQL